MDNKQTEELVRDYITKTVHFSLASVKDGKPWVCEVHFAYDNDLNVYFRSLTSRRHSQEIALNPHVAGTIVRQHALEEGCDGALYFEGTADIMTDEATRVAVMPFFQKQLGAKETILDDAKSKDGHQFYKITVKNWYLYGAFGQPKSAKYQLDWNL
ncbi:pyridoxamine 5'-phosphate oxidase family protein [Candidatus Saccharibacteria bacterium]|nr:pyridoxamine 5'-phosphate oxidase family protein [Candidatus Saccharibacteria bacterium]